MTVSESLHHILYLTLRLVLREKPKNRFFASPNSITTPLGHVPRQRHVNTNPSLSEGVARARKREYVGRKCPRVGE